jgi:hypothetical protein
MTTTKRVTVTLPVELLRQIDTMERNRSRFLAVATTHELARRQREGLVRSLMAPHPEGADIAEASLADWGAGLPPEDQDLVDVATGTPVRWVPGSGWTSQAP